MPRCRRSPGVALEHTLSGRAAYQNEWKWDLRKRLSLGRNGLGSLGSRSGRHAHGFKPAADVHLGVGLTTEMPGGGATGSSQVPLDDRELLVSAFDDKPTDRILTNGPANLALEFLQTRHAFSVARAMARQRPV
jgi:hypothetical protein